jgi:hypothetical protein
MIPPPSLEAPGKGLPWLERQVAKALVFWQANRSSPQQSSQQFQKEHEQILHRVATVSNGQWQTPVLIKRLQGLEDSSRYWSLSMVLEHLRIVNLATLANLRLLTSGETPTKVIRIEAVKPDPNSSPLVLSHYSEACETYLRETRTLDFSQADRTHAHPWFGPMTAAQWHFMMGFHMNLHRRQIEAILKGL